MNDLTPLESLFDMEHGRDLPLPPDLATLYGRLAFPPHRGRAHVVGNFVTTLDGVVTLNEPGHASGGDISGFNRHDQVVMGLLRAMLQKQEEEHQERSIAIFLLSLENHSEQFCDECCLSRAISSMYALHLSFSEHVHHLISL